MSDLSAKSTEFSGTSTGQHDPLAKATVKDLQALCKSQGIKGYSGKSKAELLKLLTPAVTVIDAKQEQKPKVQKKEKEPNTNKEKKKLAKDQQLEISQHVSVLPCLQPPCLSHILGFESASIQLIEWLKGPPTVAGLYGASGIGKTFFVHEFAKAIGYTILELPNTPDVLETPLLHNRTLHYPRVFAIQDDADKIQKSPKKLKTHLLYIGRDKFPSTYMTGPLIQVRRPTALQVAKFLVQINPSYSVQDLQQIAEQNKSDIRHILQILHSKLSSKTQTKDETIDRDAFEAHTKLYDRSLSFDRRTQFAETDPDIILCLAQESIAKLTFENDFFIKATAIASMADCIPTQAHRVALTTAIPACLPRDVRPPFCSFPLFYGKYSKREKHKKYLAQLHARKHDLETLPLVRSNLMNIANELAEQGKTIPEIATGLLRTMQREHLTYDLLFDSYEDCCYEGTELEEFDTPLQKELRRQASVE